MRIGMVLDSGFPPDIRVAKEIQALKANHDLYLLCPRYTGQASSESLDGVEIRRVFTPLKRWWARVWLMATCGSWQWKRAIGDFVAKERIEVLHVHDLPLLGAAIAVGQRNRIPVVSDLHENYPAMIETRISTPLFSIGSIQQAALRLLASVSRWTAYEQVTVPQADQVITVIEEARDRLLGVGVASDRIHVVGNYASLDDIGERSGHATDNFRLVYAGGFGATRDLPIVVRAVSLIDPLVRPGLEVLMVGGADRTYDQLRNLAGDLEVSDRVQILRWLPQVEAERLMRDANVGLVPHVKSPHTDATIPHKLFQYMWRELPIIVSDCAPLERIVSESGCGLVYASGDAASLASAIESLYDDREKARRMGEAGRVAVERRYNWHAAGEVLRGVYRQIEGAA